MIPKKQWYKHAEIKLIYVKSVWHYFNCDGKQIHCLNNNNISNNTNVSRLKIIILNDTHASCLDTSNIKIEDKLSLKIITQPSLAILINTQSS